MNCWKVAPSQTVWEEGSVEQATLTDSIRHVFLRNASVCDLLVGMLARRNRLHDQGIRKLHSLAGRRPVRQDTNNPG